VAGDTIGICPPLVITDDEINALFDMLETALNGAYVWGKAEGHLG
jgi:4-aminobutyrate--pyruvate transaminase